MFSSRKIIVTSRLLYCIVKPLTHRLTPGEDSPRPSLRETHEHRCLHTLLDAPSGHLDAGRCRMPPGTLRRSTRKYVQARAIRVVR